MAGTRPLVLALDRDDLDRLVLLADHRGPHAHPADVARDAVRAWLRGPGRAELAAAAIRLAEPA